MFQVLSWQHLWDCVFLLCSSQILWKFCLHELNDLNEAILTSPHFRGNSDGNISPPACKWEAAKSERMNQNANLAMFNFNPSSLKSFNYTTKIFRIADPTPLRQGTIAPTNLQRPAAAPLALPARSGSKTCRKRRTRPSEIILSHWLMGPKSGNTG